MRSLLVVALLAAAVVAGEVGAGPAGAANRDPAPFTGLGAWLSVYEYVPAFVHDPVPPPATPSTVDDLAALGARTLYLQAAIDDPRSSGLIVDVGLVGALLRRAHRRGMRVVAWYYPQLADPARDTARLDALARFHAGADRFDGIALDIESTLVPDVTDRNRRIVSLTQHVRAVARSMPVGAIVYPAALLEVVNPNLWPQFPYRALASSVDVWLPETYWTYRSGTYRDAFFYTDDSVKRLRRDLRDQHARVAPIGGLAESSTVGDLQGFGRAVRADRAVGRSLYDVTGTATSAWPYLRSP